MMTIEWQTSPWVAATHVVEVLRMKWLVRTMGLGAGATMGARGGGPFEIRQISIEIRQISVEIRQILIEIRHK